MTTETKQHEEALTPDVSVSDHSSIFLFTANTQFGKESYTFSLTTDYDVCEASRGLGDLLVSAFMRGLPCLIFPS